MSGGRGSAGERSYSPVIASRAWAIQICKCGVEIRSRSVTRSRHVSCALHSPPTVRLYVSSISRTCLANGTVVHRPLHRNSIVTRRDFVMGRPPKSLQSALPSSVQASRNRAVICIWCDQWQLSNRAPIQLELGWKVKQPLCIAYAVVFTSLPIILTTVSGPR
ncbi:hypothetical protein BV25DRAFT_183006 [Artomyces pyxidatus]|uniref:Uncharacterized protein n=1 Tax=Artomyces pyxidatus TaxID=48021 RepID=A0ACB8T9T1_9AGAM|nr:hypothetical protein BV25DRAFT_183006 [Artomyces pyxidatus]